MFRIFDRRRECGNPSDPANMRSFLSSIVAVFMCARSAALPSPITSSLLCGMPGVAIFHDIFSRDNKKLVLSANGDLTIMPHNSTESWTVYGTVDKSDCTTFLNFDVPGARNPVKTPLKMTFYIATGAGPTKSTNIAIFTDPSGKLASPNYSLNAWLLVYSYGL